MPIPQPLADELENAFIIRAHTALMDEIPDTDRRNAAVFGAWRKSRGAGDLEKKAYDKFADDKFVHERDVPVFKEHAYLRTLKNPDGTPQLDSNGEPIRQPERYDLGALRAICDRCNYRIADTGNFACLSEGHTPTKDELAKGAKMPPVLGFSGPFRLGMIGNKEPKWAIFQDEHYHRDQEQKIRRSPTRSPEVWLTEEMNERFMDPIAVLGAETPRLDMGMRFARTDAGVEVEKYSAAACAPGASSVFVPGQVSGDKRERYADPAADPDPQSPEPERELMLAPEDIQQIVAAVMQTDVMQWAKTQMQSQMGAATPPADPNAPPVPGDAPPANPAAPPAAPAAPAPVEPPPATPDAPPAGGPPEPEKEKDKMPYERVDEKAKYARLEEENKALAARVGKIEQEKRDTERYSKLSELRQTYALDLKKEVERTKELTDAQFVRHLECIVENYARIPIGASLFVPEHVAQEGIEAEKYSRQISERAIAIVSQERAAGNHGYTFEAARAKAVEEIKGKVA